MAYERDRRRGQNRYLLDYTPEEPGSRRHLASHRREGGQRDALVSARRKGYTAPIPPPVRASIEFTASAPAGAGRAHPEDLDVQEDGVPQEVDVFQEAVQPVTFMLALDASGSMKRSADRRRRPRASSSTRCGPRTKGLMMFANKAEIDPCTHRQPRRDAHGDRQLRGRRRHRALREEDKLGTHKKVGEEGSTALTKGGDEKVGRTPWEL